MIRTFTISRAELKAQNYKKAERSSVGEKPTTRDAKIIAEILRNIPKI